MEKESSSNLEYLLNLTGNFMRYPRFALDNLTPEELYRVQWNGTPAAAAKIVAAVEAARGLMGAIHPLNNKKQILDGFCNALVYRWCAGEVSWWVEKPAKCYNMAVTRILLGLN